MAFGRSNSLSINTGSANSVFGQQNTSQPPAPAGGLFGAATSKPGGLFGNTATQATSNTGTGTGTSSLFGSNAQQAQPQQQSGGLFGNTLGQNTQNQAQNQSQTGTTGGGVFGQAPAQPAQSSGLFSNLSQNQNQQQKPAGSAFGGFGTQQTTQAAPTSSLFGSLGQNKPAGSSLFGGNTAQQPAQQQQQQQQQSQQQPSLLAASMFNSSNAGPLGGSLTMGQGNSGSNTQPGVKIDISNIRPTTRFSDLHEDIKAKIEEIDKFIRQQESYASQCEALLPSHSNNIATIPPDVSVIEGKAETVELGLENDGRLISAAKETLKTDVKDLTRCVRVIENQSLPSRFHYGPSGISSATSALADEDYDVDLPAYFSRHADSMASTRETFAANLAEIEAHLSVVERRTAALMGEVGRDRASGLASGNDSVRELADTLRGFEGGILDAARKVGGCREGVEDLIVGRRR